MVVDIEVGGGNVGPLRRIGVRGGNSWIGECVFVVAIELRDGHVFDAELFLVGQSREQSNHSNRSTS